MIARGRAWEDPHCRRSPGPAHCNRTIDMTVVLCSRNVKEAKYTRLKRPQCESGCTARHRTLTTAQCGADHGLCVGCGGQGSRSNSHGHPHQPARPTRQGHSTLQLLCSGFQLFSTKSFKHWIDFTTSKGCPRPITEAQDTKLFCWKLVASGGPARTAQSPVSNGELGQQQGTQPPGSNTNFRASLPKQNFETNGSLWC
jgi:hypothetical protein